MLAFLKRLTGRDVDQAVEQRDQQYAALEKHGRDLDQLLAKIELATAAAESRSEASVKEHDKLQTSNGGQFRLRLDSTTNE